MLTVALAVGVLVGLALGALGGGGSILALPALVYLLGMDPHAATAGSLLVVGLTAAAGTATHARRGRVRWSQAVTFTVLGSAGAVAGTHLSAAVNPDALLAAFAVLLVITSSVMLLRTRRQPAPEQPQPTTTPRWNATRILRLVAAATIVGLLTGFFGVGGGFLVLPALILALNLNMHIAVGTSLLVITINSAIGTAGDLALAHLTRNGWA
jgi:uncharacterized membrane protein YfcA